ncbi:SLAP domain-containing protein [Lactobacillus acetotolerans]|uniref:SLAP domain-containing protein n=1 Tax=Lactobacillus acetotolerans TaxID=1600 RepID=UPI002FDA149B
MKTSKKLTFLASIVALATVMPVVSSTVVNADTNTKAVGITKTAVNNNASKVTPTATANAKSKKNNKKHQKTNYIRIKRLSFVYNHEGKYTVKNKRIVYIKKHARVALYAKNPVWINGQSYYRIGRNSYVLSQYVRPVRK